MHALGLIYFLWTQVLLHSTTCGQGPLVLNLAFCSPGLAVLLTDLHDSDHYLWICTFPQYVPWYPNIQTGLSDVVTGKLSLSATSGDMEFLPVNSRVGYYTSTLFQVSSFHIQKSSTRPHCIPVPSWANEYHEAILAQKQAQETNSTLENLTAFRQLTTRTPFSISFLQYKQRIALFALWPEHSQNYNQHKTSVARQGEKESESQCELRSRDDLTRTTSMSEYECEPNSAVAYKVVQLKSQDKGSAVACREILVNKRKLTVR
jgi:hypothetical protein